MDAEIRRIRKKARPNIAILHTRKFYDMGGFIQQYKAHVLCLLAQSGVAMYNASQAHPEAPNRLQRSFIHELGLSVEEAFLSYNLVPLDLRRDIAAIQFGEAHADFGCHFRRPSNCFPRKLGTVHVGMVANLQR